MGADNSYLVEVVIALIAVMSLISEVTRYLLARVKKSESASEHAQSTLDNNIEEQVIQSLLDNIQLKNEIDKLKTEVDIKNELIESKDKRYAHATNRCKQIYLLYKRCRREVKAQRSKEDE